MAVAKFTSAASEDCRATEAEYERLARKNPATIFLRCFAEYDEADLLFGQASVTVMPTFDLFYGGESCLGLGWCCASGLSNNISGSPS